MGVRKRVATMLVGLLSLGLLIGSVPTVAQAADPVVDVTFNANGGTSDGKSIIVKQVTVPGTLTLPATPTNPVGNFLGWYTAKDLGKGTKVVGGEPVTEAMTLWAHWQQTKVLVRFDANGGTSSAKSKVMNPGAKVGTLPTATRSRYTFTGWRTAHRHGGSLVTTKRVLPKTAVTITYFARWAPKPLFQYDKRWGSKRYRNTIRGSGCGLTAAALVVRALGTTPGSSSVTPAAAAKWALKNNFDTGAPGRTKDGFFTKWPALYGVKLTRLSTGNLKKKPIAERRAINAAARKAVEDGNWVVAFMSPGNWTQHGHFVVWYDIEGDRALVRDPNAKKAAKTRAKVSLLQAQAWRYWVVSVPDAKKLYISG